jgi:hypothetical protein
MIDDGSAIAHQLCGVGQEQAGARAFPLRVRRGEVLADVAETRRAEDRVGDRVKDDVRVAVAGEAAGMRHGDTAEHDRTFA